jgi:hypothetical protein
VARMDVTFGSAALAALCNSGERLAQRWGPAMGGIVGRRLLDLAAATAGTIDRIPDVKIAISETGETTLTFAELIVVRGIIGSSKERARGRWTDTDHIMITSLDVHGSDRR